MNKQILAILIFLFYIGNLAAQNISGVVYDSNKEPLTGVSVMVKGTTKGASTDLDGRFTISNVENPTKAILVFNFIGYKTVEKVIGSNTSFTITMEDESRSLNEVVVVGYGTQKKKDLTTAVASVSTKDIDQRPITSAAQAIEGKAAGVQVIQPSGKPGSELSIRVRGATSILASNEPLYVVDGMTTTDISFLSPTDIESMSVLKDASSAAIYGARAANGVVLITTKKGKSGEATINLNTYYGFSKIGKTIDVLNTQQYGDLLQDIDKFAGTKYYDTFYGLTNGKYKGIDTNWADETFQTGKVQSYQLSISGGNEKNKYLYSSSYQREDGVVKPAFYEKYAGRINVDNQVKSWLSLSLNVALSRNIAKNTSDNANSGRGGVIMSVLNTPPFLPIWDPENTAQYAQNPFQPSWENPLAYTERNEETKTNRVLANAAATISLIDNLKFKVNFGADYSNTHWTYFLDNVKTVYGRSSGLNGQAQDSKTNALQTTTEGLFTYDKKIKDHSFTALAGISRLGYREDYSHITAHDFTANYTGGNLSDANIIDQSSDVATEEWTTLSYIAKMTYDYKSKYLLTANFRADGSSKLNPNKRWGYFPSVSAGWRISSEPFMAFSQKYLNDLKIRFGWGQTGNQEGIGNYEYLGFWDTQRVSPTEPLSGPKYLQKTMPNPDLTWETTTQYNLGVDFSFLNSRIIFNADAYYKLTDDLLMNVILPATANVPNVKRNNGQMENKGLEFELHTVNFDNKNFKWNSDFNISFNRNKIKKTILPQPLYDASIEENGGYAIFMSAGLPMGSFYGLISEGVDPETGNMIYKDLNGNGKIGTEDYTVIGNAQPKFTYGFNNTFSYMGFDLTVFLQGVYGNDIYNASRIDMESMMDHRNQSTSVLRRWKRPGMETDIPCAGVASNNWNSTRFLEDGSYLRLKSITLNYNFTGEWLKKLHINKLGVYATGQNLLTFTKYSGYDPEVNMGGTSSTVLGVDYGTYPQSKSVIMGLNLNF